MVDEKAYTIILFLLNNIKFILSSTSNAYLVTHQLKFIILNRSPIIITFFYQSLNFPINLF